MQLYRQTLKRALDLTVQNPLLWIFGLFAALSGNGEEYDTLTSNFRFIGNSQINLDTFRDAFLDGRVGTFFHKLGETFGNGFFTIAGMVIVGIIFIIALLFLITVSQAAIIRTASQRESGKSLGFFDALVSGVSSFWPLFWLNLLAFGIIYLPLAILLLPFVLLYVSSAAMSWSVTISIISFVLLIFINLVVSFVVKFASAYIVINKLRLVEAIRESWKLFKKHWMASFELALVLLIINVIYTVLLVSVLTMLGLPFTSVGYMIFTALIVIAGSIYAVFRYSSWTFLFHAMLADRAIPKIVRLFGTKDQAE